MMKRKGKIKYNIRCAICLTGKPKEQVRKIYGKYKCKECRIKDEKSYNRK